MDETIAFDRAAMITPHALHQTMGKDSESPLKFVGQSKELKKLLRSIQQVAGIDARTKQIGKVFQAENGKLFLDEVITCILASSQVPYRDFSNLLFPYLISLHIIVSNLF